MESSSLLFLIIYFISFLLLWFENRYIVCHSIDRPLWFHGRNQSIFWLVRLILTYGSILGMWFSLGVVIAIIGLLVNWSFGKISFKIYFNREVNRQTATIVEEKRKTAQESGQAENELQIQDDSKRLAIETVLIYMKTGGNPTIKDWLGVVKSRSKI